ncbi:MAG: polymerase, sigma-24 subunit, subfamily, partial [Solirubrobacterales bacterium]|nr:polymerase, sigma-24 subunit, subfamily [Solirubrobacterales bacterium]
MQEVGQAEGAQRRRTAEQGEALVIAVMQQHADTLLRIARRHSLCDDDAADACQHALEIFLRHVGRLDAETAHRWLFRVVRHEAMAVREQRQRCLGTAALEPDLLEARTVESPEDRVVRMETMAQAAEALHTLKEAELQALWMQASGSSYAQIAARSGWTRTKVNRSLVEGRRRFLAQREAIESGQECARWRPILSALVDGRATARQLSDVRPHLRNCQSCQAHVRGLHRAGVQVAGVVPVALVAGPLAQADSGRLAGWLTRLHDAVGLQLQERVTLQLVKVQAAADALSAGKLAAVAASAAAVAGGGVAVVGTPSVDRGRQAAPSRASAVVRHPAVGQAVVADPVAPASLPAVGWRTGVVRARSAAAGSGAEARTSPAGGAAVRGAAEFAAR